MKERLAYRQLPADQIGKNQMSQTDELSNDESFSQRCRISKIPSDGAKRCPYTIKTRKIINLFINTEYATANNNIRP